MRGYSASALFKLRHYRKVSQCIPFGQQEAKFFRNFAPFNFSRRRVFAGFFYWQNSGNQFFNERQRESIVGVR